jgi:hypothetical protein
MEKKKEIERFEVRLEEECVECVDSGKMKKDIEG